MVEGGIPIMAICHVFVGGRRSLVPCTTFSSKYMQTHILTVLYRVIQTHLLTATEERVGNGEGRGIRGGVQGQGGEQGREGEGRGVRGIKKDHGKSTFFSPTATESNRKWKDKCCYYEKMKIVCKIVVALSLRNRTGVGRRCRLIWKMRKFLEQ